MRLKKQGEIERLTTRIQTLEEKHRLTDTKCVKCEYVRETLTAAYVRPVEGPDDIFLEGAAGKRQWYCILERKYGGS